MNALAMTQLFEAAAFPSMVCLDYPKYCVMDFPYLAQAVRCR